MAPGNKKPASSRKTVRKQNNRRVAGGDTRRVENSNRPSLVPEVLHSQTPERSRYLDTSLPPLYKLDEIYKDLADKALRLGLLDLVKKLAGRPLRVATVCSGTESPLLALEMIENVLGPEKPFKVSHLFSCEIVPFKQAYIERNFSPPILFRDFCELKNESAQTAYGSFENVPGDLHMLVAGTACVDFSGLNSNKPSQGDTGESMSTFNALLEYSKVYRPRIMVLENVRGAPWKTFSESLREIDYLSIEVPVDSKEYYIPQTRQRGYMVAIDAHRLNGCDETGKKAMLSHFKQLVIKFQRPASSPAGMFLLEDEDARREQIDKDLVTRLEASISRGEVNWDRYKERHQKHREKEETGNQRPVSRSQSGGVTCRPPEFYLQAWFEAQVERVWETLDIKYLIGLGKGCDMHYKELWMDLSQGVDRGGDNINSLGVASCLTPCGMQFTSTRGAPLSGLEALALQALPTDRMMLTRESQRDCQDLAGNAMTSTVVCAAMLAALIAGSRVLDEGAEPQEQAAVANIKQLTFLGKHELIPTNFDPSLNPLVERMTGGLPFSMASEVLVRLHGSVSARHCFCEKQSGMKTSVVECPQCEHTACSSCAGNPAHSYRPVKEHRTTSPLEFTAFLKMLLPMRVELSGLRDFNVAQFEGLFSTKWGEYLDAIRPVIEGRTELRFLDIKRTQIWTVVYEGEHCNLHLEITRDIIQWLLFVKAPADAPAQSLIREIFAKPFARMSPKGDNFLIGCWQVCAPLSARFPLKIAGEGAPTKAFAAALGLQTAAAAELQVRSSIRVDGDFELLAESERPKLDVEVRGRYDHLPECGTALGCLYKQRAPEGESRPAVFLFLDPRKTGRLEHDSFVFALEHERIPGYNVRSTIAELTPTWRATNVSDDGDLVDAFYRHWQDAPLVELKKVESERMETSQLDPDARVDIELENCHGTNVPLAKLAGPSELLNMKDVGESWGPVNPEKFNQELKSTSWALQQFSTWVDFEGWRRIGLTYDLPHDRQEICAVCGPRTPKILWGRSRTGHVMPYEDPKDAAVFEKAVKSKPPAFMAFRKVVDDRGELVFALNIQSLAHHACLKLASLDDSEKIGFEWRLISNARDLGRQSHPGFTIPHNKGDPEAEQPPNFKFHLRPEQLRSVHWMIEQDLKEVAPFTEQEVEEAFLPLLLWRAEVKATMPCTIRGGVLADEVGYGKTATVLALIDHGFEKNAREQTQIRDEPPIEGGQIAIKATLILVPNNVFRQWSGEIKKFLGSKYRVLEIHKSEQLSRTRVADIMEADIVLVSWTVFQSASLYRNLQRFTGTPHIPSCGRAFDSWLEGALRALREVVQTLVADGPESFLCDLASRRQKLHDEQTASTYVPSRRLRGRAFAAAQQATGKNEGEDDDALSLAAGEDSAFKPSGEALNPAKKRKRDEQDEPADHESEENDRKIFNIPGTKAGTQTEKPQRGKKPAPKWKDWRDMTNVPLHAFRFNRFVIDEYTYIGEDRRVALNSMAAVSKWLLSGTPGLGDFADVKSIADYLGIHLGIDDDGDAPTQNARLKTLRRNATAVEAFMMFQPRRSQAWHEERHRHAQSFLDRFARQNSAEIEHIPVETHYHLCMLSSEEKAAYDKLHGHLVSHRGRTRKMKNPTDDTEVTRLNQILESTRSPEEALLKCSTTASLSKADALQSSKIKELIELVKQVPDNERVLLFVQFPDLMHVVAEALGLSEITYGMATSKKTSILKRYAEPDPTRPGAATSAAAEEQGRKGSKVNQKNQLPKVLMLHLGSAMAAGLNLQMINHVVFLSPLLALTQHEYEAGMTQAIGRCRRYGQERTVHVHHMLSAFTADLNVWQDRTSLVLVRREGGLVPVAREALREEEGGLEGPAWAWE